MSWPNETRGRLMRWGRWASGGVPGFPRMSALARIKSGSRGTGDETNPELIRTNQVIGFSQKHHRMIIIRHFCTSGSIREKAGRHGLPKSTYWDVLDEAVWWVHTEYDKVLAPPDKKRYLRPIVGVPTAIHTL
jgi:hypothetical protein